MTLFSKLMVAKNNQGRPPRVRAAPSGRHRCFKQCRWSDTRTGAWRGGAIAFVIQNLPGEHPKMLNYPCFE